MVAVAVVTALFFAAIIIATWHGSLDGSGGSLSGSLGAVGWVRGVIVVVGAA
jgi:hypothetical protein